MKSSLGNAWHIVGLITQALLNRFLVAQRVLVAQMLKESACNAGDAGLIPGWEDPLEKGMAFPSSILAW